MSIDTINRPKIRLALNDVAIRKAKPTGKVYSLSDGNGLSLLIDSNGNKGWRFRCDWHCHFNIPLLNIIFTKIGPIPKFTEQDF